jgi:uncharacterized membrane protein
MQPHVHFPGLRIPSGPRVNVGGAERLVSLAGGMALAVAGLSRRSAGGAALAVLGGLLALRGATGRCELYRRLGTTTACGSQRKGVPGNAGLRVERAICVERTPDELYHFWRELSNLPAFMPHLDSVREHADGHSHWVVKGPAGSRLVWDAEIIDEAPGEKIAWQSLPGALVRNAGSVRFEPLNHGTATKVKVALEYLPPAGAAGALVARIFGSAPEQQLDADLARFKEVMESGEGE